MNDTPRLSSYSIALDKGLNFVAWLKPFTENGQEYYRVSIDEEKANEKLKSSNFNCLTHTIQNIIIKLLTIHSLKQGCEGPHN